MKSSFLDTPQCVKSFYDRTEKDLCIHDIGYHDFHTIRSFHFYRTQRMYTVHLVLSGKGYLKFHQKTYTLQKYDVFVLPPNELFSYYPDEDDPWEYIFFDFYGDKVVDYLNDIGFSNDTPTANCPTASKILPAFFDYFEKNKNGFPVSYYETSSLLFSLFHTLLSRNEGDFHSPKNLIAEAKNLIRLKFFEPDLSVKTIADALHISHSHLCRKFKEQTGVTMIAYITDQRIKYAETLLKNTTLTANQIAYMSGFSEYTYFLMTFKRKNKMTTKEYRESLTPPP